MAYSKIRQPKLSDVIEQQLEFLILEGTLRPGEKLPPERELAKQFDVSRPSLREAIQRLEAKGLLLRRQGGGTLSRAAYGKASAIRWWSCSPTILSHSMTCSKHDTPWKVSPLITPRCVVPMKTRNASVNSTTP